MSDQSPQDQPPPPVPGAVPPVAPNTVPPGGYAPPPGYGVPPGYAPPPGYGYGGQQPPPVGYPGYPPPNQPYYPPPLYMPPPLPREYAIPPAMPGYPWQVIPPAQGTLFQAWRSIATNFSRQNIAAWAQAKQPGWVRNSIGIYLACKSQRC